MAVTGIGYGNSVISNPYRNKTSGKETAQEFDANYSYGNDAIVQDVNKAAVNPNIDPLKVDPRNATYEEIQVLNHYLVEKGLLNEKDINFFEHPTQNDSEKADYYEALSKWRDMQYQAGNMVGYKNAAKVCDTWSGAVKSMAMESQYHTDVRRYNSEMEMVSGAIGFGELNDGKCYYAVYDDKSTIGNPIIEVRIRSANGKEEAIKVNINNIDPSNATSLEMFALCAHVQEQRIAGSSEVSKLWEKMLAYAQYSQDGDMRAKNTEEFTTKWQNWNSMISKEQLQLLEKEKKVESASGEMLQTILGTVQKLNADREKSGLSRSELMQHALSDGRPEDNGVPYYYLAKDGLIEYNGVTFVCDEEHKAIHLGDTSDPKRCLNIPLSGGGSLIVNRDNLDDLAKAISMFTPEDVKLILWAIAQDAKVQQMKNEIDEETSGIGLAKEIERQETENEE